MIKFKTAILVVITLAAVACKNSKKSPKKDPQVQALISSKPFVYELKAVVKDTASYGKDACKLSDVRVSGDTLFVKAEYGGGCKDHVFTARHNGQYMKSMPPQLNLMIDHNGNGDSCRELIHESLAFDLKSCRNGKSGSIVLLINGDRSNKVTYTY
jgi:hypothetical protein